MGSFSTYATIKTGLPTTSGYKYFETFEYNSELYMLLGMNAYNLTAWKWNSSSSTWESNTLFQTFDTNPGTGLFPTVFYYNSNLYLICGKTSPATKFGFIWNGSQWVTNAAIINGLTFAKTYDCPDVFYKGSDLYMLVGGADGVFTGWKYNGSSWVSDTAIASGLTGVPAYSRGQSIIYNGELYFVHNGAYAWKWNGTTWATSTFATGITLTGNVGKAAIFEWQGYLYYIQTNNTTTLQGYRYTPASKISSLSIGYHGNCLATFKANLSAPLEPGETFTAYLAPSTSYYGNAAYEVVLSKIDDLTYGFESNYKETETYAFQVLEKWAGTTLQTISINGTFYIMAALTETAINITDANNYRIFNSPQHSFNHGLIFFNGSIYGSARNQPNLGAADIFKIVAGDYASYIQKTIYQNKTGSLNRIYKFDQIIQAGGFIWVHSGQFLIRLNATDLDYMVFSGLPEADSGEPPCSDLNYIYLTSGLAATKLDLSKLTGSFASYGYDGSAPVSIPANTILGNCNFIQRHPTSTVYVHSSAVDSQFLYVNCSTTTITNGHDNDLNIDVCHFQKIRKSDMVTVGDIWIPLSTDDMVQNSDYMFLAPEISGVGADSVLGSNYGLYAINKNTLQIKYLKGLKPQSADTASTKAAYGVFYFNNKVVVQTITYRRTYVISLANIENWGDAFPIGGATEAIYTYQLNGVALTVPNNELVLDQAGYVHTNTWEANTMLFKFNLSQLTPAVNTPNIQTSLISSNSNSATFGGFIISEGNSPVTSGGFKWGTAPEALTNDLPADPFSYDFQELLSGLSAGVYYFKAYGTNTEGTFYGNTLMFSIEAASYNAVSLHHNDTIALLEFVNTHFGCSIRCVQDAPGVATGTTGTVTDQDGNTYDTVVINEKRWMVQNLKTKKYRNGDAIPEVSGATAWQELSSGGYCNVI